MLSDPLIIAMTAIAGILTGTASLLWYVARLIYSGRLVPRATLDEMIKDRDAWKDVAMINSELAHVQTAQVGRVLRAVPPEVAS